MTNIALLSLSQLQTCHGAKLTRYQLMIKINQNIGPLLPPYSPGAVYHELKKMIKNNLIDIDHDSQLSITHDGMNSLHTYLCTAAIPSALAELLVFIIASAQIEDAKTRQQIKKRLQLNMIKKSQNQAKPGQILLANKQSLEIWSREVSELAAGAVAKIVALI